MIFIEKLPQDLVVQQNEVDFLELEWYEVNRTYLKRKTVLGVPVKIQWVEKLTLQDGQVIYQDEGVSIRIRIKECLCILLTSDSIHTIGKFCYDVGNRHLPIFQVSDQRIAVSYDARLFQALKEKYEDQVVLEEMKLLPNTALKAFGNFI